MGKVKIRSFGAIPLGVAIFCWPVSAQAEGLVVKLVNGTRADLIGFHVSHTGTKRWEENFLEGGYLAPKYEVNITVTDGQPSYHYDFLSKFKDGEKIEEYDVGLCYLDEYTHEA